MPRRGKIGRLPLLSILGGLWLAAGCGGGAERPNVVLISIDTLRPDHLSCYGYGRPTSPFLDSLAAGGAVFSDCHSVAPWTRPAMASLFTGLHPRSHGVWTTDLVDPDGTRWPMKIDPSFTTLAEALKKAGYRTFGISANPQAGVWAGSDQGFDFFIETGDIVTADKVHEMALSLKEKLPGDKPYFLWIFYYDPHAPYHARRPWVESYEKDETLLADPLLTENYLDEDWEGKISLCGDPRRLEAMKALYDSEINYADDYIRKLFKEVIPPGDDPLVIVHADHGEEFLEHGLLGHGRSVFAPSIRIPLIVRAPGGKWAGRKISQTCGIIDIYPTILDCLGLEPPRRLEGISLLPWLEGEKDPVPRRMICELEEEESPRLQGLLDRPWRFIRSPGGAGRWLFDFSRDPGEAENLAGAEPERLAELERALEKWMSDTLRFEYTRREQRWTSEARDKLRALGYLK